MPPLPKRTKRARAAAYAGGAILVLTGGPGAVGLVRFGWRAVESLAPVLGRALGPLFVLALLVAALGGFSVLAGAYLLGRRKRLLGKLFLRLGAGVGLLSFAIDVVLLAMAGENPLVPLVSTAATLRGVGLLLALYAQATG